MDSLYLAIVMFSYYSHWIANYFEMITPLVPVKIFSLSKLAEKAIEWLKAVIENSVEHFIDETIPFVVEMDASAPLNQAGRLVAFFSRTLNTNEQKHSAIEKAAYAMVEALHKW